MAIVESTSDISTADIVRLGAEDSAFFARAFFPKTFRVKSPAFHGEMWNLLDDAAYRLVHMRCFRGSAKTTLCRTWLAKRVAYGISRTCLFLGAKEDDAARSVAWLRGQIERNKLFAQTFGLELEKANETELRVYVHSSNVHCWIRAGGITGSVRGLNFDDYRPDTIIADDVLTDENVISQEQRVKVRDLLLGAVRRSLISEVEAPNAKFAFLNTPLHLDDASAHAIKDPLWTCKTFACWTPETLDVPYDEQISSWEDLYPTNTLRKEKQAAIEANTYSIFAREMECKLVSSEEASFKRDWIQTMPVEDMPNGFTIIAIDPVPPPSERQLEKNLQGKDNEAIVALTRHNGNYYVRDYALNKGHDPGWTVNKALEFAMRYSAARIVPEAIAYQRTLVYLLQQEMSRRRTYFAVLPFTSRMAKYNRIVSAISGVGFHKRLFCGEHHHELLVQFEMYPRVPHDDLLDALAIGLLDVTNPSLEAGDDEYEVLDEADYKPITLFGGAP